MWKDRRLFLAYLRSMIEIGHGETRKGNELKMEQGSKLKYGAKDQSF